jgi:hypothetical protein
VGMSAFYAVVAGIDFTLLGLWWVAVSDRADLREHRAGGTAYLVSLQFVVPGTASLLSQVAPNFPVLWRASFTLAGVAGAGAVLMLAPALARAKARAIALPVLFLGVPLYCLVALVAALPEVARALSTQLTGLQLEALMFCLLVFLGVQTAWAAAMSPSREGVPANDPTGRQ